MLVNTEVQVKEETGGLRNINKGEGGVRCY